MTERIDDLPEVELRLADEEPDPPANTIPLAEKGAPPPPEPMSLAALIVWRVGDEPDRPYDVLETVQEISPVASIESFTAAMTRTAQTPGTADVSSKGFADAGLTSKGDEDETPPDAPKPATTVAADVLIAQRWQPSPLRDWVAPLVLLLAGTVAMFALTAQFSFDFKGAAAAARYLCITLLIRIPLMWLTCLNVARWLDIPLGRAHHALLKLAAIAIAPLTLAAMLLPFFGRSLFPINAGLMDPFVGGGGGALGAVIAAVVILSADVALFYLLFDLDSDEETWWLIVIGWLAQLLAGGLAVHLILNPIPYTAPYVPPAHPFHFMIGN